MTVALVALATLLAAGVQATAGLGFALILSPVLLALLAPEAAITSVTALALVLNLLVLFSERRRPHVAWGEVGPILLAAAPGSVCGLLLLRALPKPALQIAVGAIVIAVTLARTAPVRPRMLPAGARVRLAVGLLAGVLSTSTGVNGPLLALWLSGRGLTFARVRDSLSAAFLGMGTITLLTLVPVLHEVRIPPAMLAAAPAALLAGHAIGSRLHPRLGARRLERLLQTVVLASGVSALALGLAAV